MRNQNFTKKSKIDKLTPRSVDQAKWYQDLLRMAKLADYSPVRGCMVFRPYGYRIWELMKGEMDRRIKKMGVDNAYFPLLIPYSFLEKESKHVEGFAPEVAIVTHAGGSELKEKLVIRPTSETMIYSMFAKWVESYRDLPMKINQWSNVVRWEKRTMPFMRTSEFLWQEGHTLHADKKEAKRQVVDALDMYHAFMEDFLAMYTIRGEKTETERFAGAEATYSVEAMMRDGKALQMGTSHLLSHNFVKSFGVEFTNESGELHTPWATSWGASTRMIGGVIFAHGDDSGLVLPPKIAPIQVQIVPILRETSAKARETMKRFIDEKIVDALEDLRVSVDWSDNSPGWKFAQSELCGVPLRLEVGQREIESGEVSFAKRSNGEKGTIVLTSVENLKDEVKRLLDEVQLEIFKNHKKFTQDLVVEVDNFNEFEKAIDEMKLVKCFYKETIDREKEIKEKTKATTRNMPLNESGESGRCFYSGEEGGRVTYFARAY